MPRIELLPHDDKSNGWSAILPARTPKSSLRTDVRADWVVVGAGFAGLAAARRVAENRPNEHVVLVEAQQVGEGASGRNSGFAIDLPHNIGHSLEELEGSNRFMRLARAAIEQLKRQVDTHGIQCDWHRSGKYHAAVSPRGSVQVLEPFAKELDALGEPYRWVDDVRAELGTAHFTKAVYTPGNILMNPAALTRGLGDHLPDNVTLYEDTPVTQADYRNGTTLQTPGGSIFAPKLIVAVNGFAQQFGFYERSLLTFAAHASLTRPLTPDERATLGSVDEWGLTPANAFAGITMRLTHDQRILIRQDISFNPAMRASDEWRHKVRVAHKRLLDRRFPGLLGVEMEHTWTGFICLSKNGAPGFGRVTPNIYAAVCQNAVGVTKGTIGGILAADMACDVENPLIDDMLSLGTPARVPPRPLLDISVRATFAWEIFKARHEA